MVKKDYPDSMPRSVSSSPINSDASIDINDDDDDISQSPKREPLSSPVHQNGSMNSSKPSKLSFSISRLLGANSGSNKHNHSGATSEGESESPSSLCSQCPSTENNATVASYPSPVSPDTKCNLNAHRVTMSPYEAALSHLTGTSAASVIRVPAHRPPPTMPYTTHYPWLGPTPPTLIKDGLQSKSIIIVITAQLKQNYNQMKNLL